MHNNIFFLQISVINPKTTFQIICFLFCIRFLLDACHHYYYYCCCYTHHSQLCGWCVCYSIFTVDRNFYRCFVILIRMMLAMSIFRSLFFLYVLFSYFFRVVNAILFTRCWLFFSFLRLLLYFGCCCFSFNF